MQNINISAQVSKKLNDELERIASSNERTKSYCVRKALELYIAHQKMNSLQEDLEDYEDAKKALEEFENSGRKTFSHKEVFEKVKNKI